MHDKKNIFSVFYLATTLLVYLSSNFPHCLYSSSATHTHTHTLLKIKTMSKKALTNKVCETGPHTSVLLRLKERACIARKKKRSLSSFALSLSPLSSFSRWRTRIEERHGGKEREWGEPRAVKIPAWKRETQKDCFSVYVHLFFLFARTRALLCRIYARDDEIKKEKNIKRNEPEEGGTRIRDQTHTWWATTVSGVTILLSLTVFLNLVAETLPQVSDAIPLLGTTK